MDESGTCPTGFCLRPLHKRIAIYYPPCQTRMTHAAGPRERPAGLVKSKGRGICEHSRSCSFAAPTEEETGLLAAVLARCGYFGRGPVSGTTRPHFRGSMPISLCLARSVLPKSPVPSPQSLPSWQSPPLPGPRSPLRFIPHPEFRTPHLGASVPPANVSLISEIRLTCFGCA